MRGDKTKIEALSRVLTDAINNEKDFFNAFSATMIALTYIYESRLQKGDSEWEKFKNLVNDAMDIINLSAQDGTEQWKLNPQS